MSSCPHYNVNLFRLWNKVWVFQERGEEPCNFIKSKFILRNKYIPKILQESHDLYAIIICT